MMDDFDLDRCLAREPEVRPSSRFAANVMAAVRREAALPPPIEFPWRRALPGLVVAGIALAGLTALVVLLAVTVDWASVLQPSAPSPPWLRPAAWTAGACLLTWVSVRASALLAVRRA